MDGAQVVRILRRLEEASVSTWLDGGWGVDALLRKQSRVHDDLDLIATVADSPALISGLGDLGYELAAGAPHTNYVLLDGVGRQVDVHPVTFDAGGNGIYRMANGRDWAFPSRGFAGTGLVDGYEVHCLTADVQVLCHNAADYQFDEDDYRDLWSLHERFGVEVPQDVAEWGSGRVLLYGPRPGPAVFMEERTCRFKSGDGVRIASRQDVPPPFASAEGVVLSAQSTEFGCLYRVRLMNRTVDDIGTRLLAATFHEEQLEAIARA